MNQQTKRIVEDMPNSEYHGGKAVSKSTLDLASKDLFRPNWARNCPQDQDKIKTFDFGDAMHAICLEPERLKSEFVVMPPFNLRTNEGKKEKTLFMFDNHDKKILTSDEHKKLTLMFESVMAHIPARALIEARGEAEGSYFWTDETTGLECKCRPDKHIVRQNLLVDVKTAPELAKFHFSVDDYRYHVQNAWYCDGVSRFVNEPVRMEFLVIQKTIEIGRYPVMVCKLPDDAVEYGRALYREDLNRYADFLNAGEPIETQELPMSYRFINEMEEKLGEVSL
jgi:exodeoxyribonuclease VIII